MAELGSDHRGKSDQMSVIEKAAVAEEPQRAEQTRARYPDEEGYIERDGVRVFYEVYGTGEPTILFCPTWTLVHSRIWKMQIPYFARHHRVIVFDPRGNGKSDRPTEVDAYAESEFAQDAIDVMDATGTERAVDRQPLARRPARAAACRRASRTGHRRRLHRAVASPPAGSLGGCAGGLWPIPADAADHAQAADCKGAGGSSTPSTGARTTAISSSGSSPGRTASLTRPRASTTGSSGGLKPTRRHCSSPCSRTARHRSPAVTSSRSRSAFNARCR